MDINFIPVDIVLDWDEVELMLKSHTKEYKGYLSISTRHVLRASTSISIGHKISFEVKFADYPYWLAGTIVDICHDAVPHHDERTLNRISDEFYLYVKVKDVYVVEDSCLEPFTKFTKA